MTELCEGVTLHPGGRVEMSQAYLARAAAAVAAFDPAAFGELVPIAAARVTSARDTQRWVKALRKHTLALPKVRQVLKDPEHDDARLILLGRDEVGGQQQEQREQHRQHEQQQHGGAPGAGGSDGAAARERVVERARARLPADVVAEMDEHGVRIVVHDIQMDYSHLSAEQVLRRVLPSDVDVQTSFETIGHVAHLNVRDELRPYGALIGRVLLDKNAPRIRTVVNKTAKLENEFRVPELEVLAGDACLETEVRQYGAVFRLDYGKVYWNSRLEREHARLVARFAEGDAVCDMMCGIGPFAVPAALKGCTVWANDLNPDSTRYLRINAALNRVQARVHVSTECARAFVRRLSLREGVRFAHCVMNLPASAVEFLDAFRGAFDADFGALPLVHCYMFVRPDAADGLPQAESLRRQAQQMVEHHLGGPLDGPFEAHDVRDVAPNKHMMCATFRVPEAVGRLQPAEGAEGGAGGGDAKRQRTHAGDAHRAELAGAPRAP